MSQRPAGNKITKTKIHVINIDHWLRRRNFFSLSLSSGFYQKVRRWRIKKWKKRKEEEREMGKKFGRIYIMTFIRTRRGDKFFPLLPMWFGSIFLLRYFSLSLSLTLLLQEDSFATSSTRILCILPLFIFIPTFLVPSFSHLLSLPVYLPLSKSLQKVGREEKEESSSWYEVRISWLNSENE